VAMEQANQTKTGYDPPNVRTEQAVLLARRRRGRLPQAIRDTAKVQPARDRYDGSTGTMNDNENTSAPSRPSRRTLLRSCATGLGAVAANLAVG
jgi:hypothetical protein